MSIIFSGKFKNTLLGIPKNFFKILKLNYIPIFIKKKIFSWLGCMNKYYCLDLFSGTGSFSFESLSRGCIYSLMFEKNKKIFIYLKNFLNKMNIKNAKVLNCNFLEYLKLKKINTFYNYNLVFINTSRVFLKQLLKCLKIVLKFFKKGCFVYLETVFDVSLFFKKFRNNIKILKNDFFKKINFYLFEII